MSKATRKQAKNNRQAANALRAYGQSLQPRSNQVANVNTQQSSSGIGFTGALFLVFLVLKLTHVISWSWWWICAPLWGPLALFIVIVLLVVLPIAVLKA